MGDWKNHFNAELEKDWNAWAEDKLSEIGFGQDEFARKALLM